MYQLSQRCFTAYTGRLVNKSIHVMLRLWKYQAQLQRNHLLPRMDGQRTGMGLEHSFQKGEANRFHKGETHTHHCPFQPLGDFLGQGKEQGDSAPPWSRNPWVPACPLTPGVTGLERREGAWDNTNFALILIVIQEN